MKTPAEVEALYTANMGQNHSAALAAVYAAGATDARGDDLKAKEEVRTQSRSATPASAPSNFAHLLKPKQPGLAHK